MSRPLRVFAAGSLRPAFEPSLTGPSAWPDGPVVFRYANARDLAHAIERGELADVFASASSTDPARLEASGRLARVVPFARNRVVIGVPAEGPSRIEDVADLGRPGTRVVIEIAGVPLGEYTREALGRLDRSGPGRGDPRERRQPGGRRRVGRRPPDRRVGRRRLRVSNRCAGLRGATVDDRAATGGPGRGDLLGRSRPRVRSRGAGAIVAGLAARPDRPGPAGGRRVRRRGAGASIRSDGGVAQRLRAAVLYTAGPWFESRLPYQPRVRRSGLATRPSRVVRIAP